jgi:site-specific DNA recombinase
VIDPAQAEIVRRIFQDYADGKAPRAIAFALNAAGIAGPRGAEWAQSTINGNRERGTGILNNELYIGRLIWNRLEYRKDPDTGKRVSRLNPPEDWRIIEVPELRIIDQPLWESAKARQHALDARLERKQDPSGNRRSGICETRRPQHLLSGFIRCGVCGGGMSLVGGTSYGCSTARNKGTCRNRRTIQRHGLEALVLDGLKEQLMAPDAVAAFIAEFHREINRRSAEIRTQAEVVRRALDKVEREIQALVDAVKRGAFSAALQRELSTLERRQADLLAQVAGPVATPVTIHPSAAEIYRRKVAGLHEALAAPETRAAAADALRDLIQEVRITPEGDGNAVELVGALAALLHLSGNKNAATLAGAADSGLLVAGTCNHLYRTKITALSRR